MRDRKYRDMDILKWDGHRLRLKDGRLLATVEPDAKWPGMYRVRLKDGQLTDMANLSRAKDAARFIAMSALNNPAQGVRKPASAPNQSGAITAPKTIKDAA
jgi:hypothetical protein